MDNGRNRRRRPADWPAPKKRSRPPAQRRRAPIDGMPQAERRPKRRQAQAQRQPAQGKKPRKKNSIFSRRHGGGVLFRLVTMLVLVAVVLLGVAIFFKVGDIQVTGNSLYRAEEVIEASGIAEGDNLMTLSKGAVAGRINAVLPYVESVRVERRLPDTVVIHLTESSAVYAIETDEGSAWLMSGGGKLLEPADISAASYPRITGITAKAPKAGAQVDCEQQESLAAALTLMELLEETDYISQIAEVNVERAYDIIVWYGAEFEIHLGGTDELAYKMQYLTSILDDPRVEGGGVIDLTLQEKRVAIFKPWGN